MKIKSKVILVAALVWISSGMQSTAFTQSDSATIRGTVVDLSGKPGTCIAVLLFVRSGPIDQALTNVRGEFQFSNLQPGSYAVDEDFGFSGQVQLGKGDSVRFNIVDSGSGAIPQDASVSMSGRVTDASGAAIPGVKVTVKNAVTRTITATFTTDGKSLGMYYFPNLEPGTYAVTASAINFETFSANVELASATTIQKNITLISTHDAIPQKASILLRGRVTDPYGGRIPGVVVTATNNVARTMIRTITPDLVGTYSFPNLEPGTYTVTASLAGFYTFSASVELANATTVEKNIMLGTTPGEKARPFPFPRVCSTGTNPPR